ncbi:divergent polysaccharide deacetylase family protein [Lacibacterium aquatile]|uniref:Divergent polysaccharide deacetylase family protein n=1 Tax=Lacibacterium aquatile TaxID=1168082 RepID=A0ABW5DJL3_9PROT
MAAKGSRGKKTKARRLQPGLWLTIGALAMGGFGCGLVIGTQIPEKEPVEKPFETALAPLPFSLPAPVPASQPPEVIPEPVPAVLAPPPAPAPTIGPAWQRFAQKPPALSGRIPITVVIDDMGVDHKRSQRTTMLPGPLTLSYLPYARDLSAQAAAAFATGHELMLHMPMQAETSHVDPGPNPLLVGLGPEEIRRRVRAGLSSFNGFVGVNNHMGSRFTADTPGMSIVMQELQAAGVLWLDSRTTPRTVGVPLAKAKGIPTLSRDVFLDDDPKLAAVRKQLATLETVARKHGHGIAIGHPKDDTITALAEWLPTLPGKGFVLVPITALLPQSGHTDVATTK